MINAYEILIGELNKRDSLGRSRLKWEDTIKINLKNGIWGCGPNSSNSG
jgi:hypothetical protein